MAEPPAPTGPGPTTRDLEAAKAFGLSVNGLTPVDIGKVGLPGDLYLTHGDVGPTLPAMPDDILFQIWCEVEDPRSLVKTCQRLYSLSRLVDLRAQWLLSRYEAYEVIYEGICRPRLFDAWLLRTLLNRGAKLSRALVQEVAYRSVCHIEHDWKSEQCGVNLHWGTKLSTPAVYAVLNEGYRLYGSNVNLKTRDNDIFCGALYAQSAKSLADLKDLFEDYNTAPPSLCPCLLAETWPFGLGW
ncbi:hypothetical protein IE81DRAFT_170964 [Ceraceosorus guamensis]|uniref:F-box domain-containing protein n=1 Tax=Ceraceosorus guamensis TaxID=1522189 RepID=A0A316VV81_9BASI|nr:hypothetical protein IE81DRAFT_170964 [Ceraceosorus guamensis]PWN41536.1 hypothetical protein IE81DRAFT_170964 [Ceraceosorus guamensis]